MDSNQDAVRGENFPDMPLQLSQGESASDGEAEAQKRLCKQDA